MMTFQQFQVILNKIKQTDKTDVNIHLSGNRIHRISAEFNRGAVEIVKCPGGFNIGFKTNISGTRAELRFAFRFGIFSPSWYIWRWYCRGLERKSRLEDRLIARKEIEEKKRAIDEAMLETFPELLEDELLGDD